MNIRYFITASICVLLSIFFNAGAQSNIAVVRVGDGSASLTTAAAPVFIDIYSPSGVFVQTIPLPDTTGGSSNPFTLSGTATSEGALTLSADGQYLSVAGYSA